MINLFKRRNKKEKLLAKVKRNVGFDVKNTQQSKSDTTFSKWLNDNKKYGMLPPPMELEQFEKFLIQYLFDKEHQIVMPVSEKQARTEILFDILSMYSKKFKREWKAYTKEKQQ